MDFSYFGLCKNVMGKKVDCLCFGDCKMIGGQKGAYDIFIILTKQYHSYHG